MCLWGSGLRDRGGVSCYYGERRLVRCCSRLSVDMASTCGFLTRGLESDSQNQHPLEVADKEGEEPMDLLQHGDLAFGGGGFGAGGVGDAGFRPHARSWRLVFWVFCM